MNLRSLPTELQDQEDALFSAQFLKNVQVLGYPLGPVGKSSGSGHGAFLLADDGHRYFDLTTDTRRNYLGHGHPLALKAKLEATRWTASADADPESSDEYKQAVSIISKTFFPGENVRISLHVDDPHTLAQGHATLALDTQAQEAAADKVMIEDFYVGRSPGFLSGRLPCMAYVFRGPLPYSVWVAWKTPAPRPVKLLSPESLIYGAKLLRFVTEGNFLGPEGRIARLSRALEILAQELGCIPDVTAKARGTTISIAAKGLHQRLERKGVASTTAINSDKVILALPTSLTEEHFKELSALLVGAAKDQN